MGTSCLEVTSIFLPVNNCCDDSTLLIIVCCALLEGMGGLLRCFFLTTGVPRTPLVRLHRDVVDGGVQACQSPHQLLFY